MKNNYTVVVISWAHKYGERVAAWYVNGLDAAREVCGGPLHYSRNTGGWWRMDHASGLEYLICK